MKCIVVGAGRSGTNLTLEIMTGNKNFTHTEMVEDKDLFIRDAYLKSGYLAKCDTIYCRSYLFFNRVMIQNTNMKVLWTIRHPYDMAISKVYRGHQEEQASDDATLEGCVADMYHSWALYKRGIAQFPNSILLVKMEDTIRGIEAQAKRICGWLGLEYEENMKYPYTRMRDKGKKERYKDLDKSQIDMYKDWQNLYDGWFIKNNIQLDNLFELLKPMVHYFGYEV
jgi:hypothetical protein